MKNAVVIFYILKSKNVTYDNIKSCKTAEFQLLLEKYSFEKATGGGRGGEGKLTPASVFRFKVFVLQ